MGTTWLREREIAAILKVQPGTIRAWRRRGKIPFHQIGGRYFYDLAEVAAATRREPGK
jgi:excisionase family DNA binding protein